MFFDLQKHPNIMANYWYAYNGVGDPTLASSYSKIEFGNPSCTAGAELCAIYVTGGDIPFSPLTSNILTYIANGKTMWVPQPQLPTGTKFFVYMRS